MILTRRALFVTTVGLALPGAAAYATIPPPPISPWYLIFIADGIYKISGFYIVDLPASVGTATSYDQWKIDAEVRKLFTFTGKRGISPWAMLTTGVPTSEWWEVYDRRNGRFFRLWYLDRFEVRFADKSRVKVRFNGPNATLRFTPLVGTERLPDGTRLYPRERDRDGGDGKGRGLDGGGVTGVTPSVKQFAWHWSSQETPW